MYFFSIYVLGDYDDWAHFDLKLNDDVICSTLPDHNGGGVQDFAPGSRSAVVDVAAGNYLSLE